jgi:chemotaxis protein MotB
LSRLEKMRARQRLLDDGDDTGRWIVSYADFITLLFAFFVVMYSISSVNDGKFRVLSDTMTTVFNEPAHRPVPIDLGGTPPPSAEPADADTLAEVALEQDEERFELDVKPLDIDAGAPLGERMSQALAPFIEDESVVVRDGQMWLVVELPSELLFASGRAELTDAAAPVIATMGAALRGVETPIRVEGFTDNVPLNGGRYGSNWGLSAARAAALVDRFAATGIDPAIMSAIGYGEFHPVADNSEPDGRRANRRVVVAVAKHESVDGGQPVADAVNRVESLPAQTLQRITELPEALDIL